RPATAMRTAQSSTRPRSPSAAPLPCGRLRVALQHLGLENTPYLAMKRVKFPVQPDLENIARARQRHPPVADDARTRSCRHDHHPICERDRLFEVVGDEQHRLAIDRKSTR